MSHYHSQSPPPLRHPVPTHPAYIPEPPSTPSSPQGYQRFSSSPGPGGPVPAQPLPPPHLQHHMQQQGQGQPIHPGSISSGPMHPQQQQQQGGQHVPYVPAYAGAFQGSYGGGNMGGDAGAFQPNFGAWGINDTTAQLGMQLGQSAVAAGQDYVQRNFGTIFPRPTVKHHFNVSNSYVLHKLRLVLFPWLHKPWARRTKRTEQGLHEWQPPRDDVNSPDLYIPVMAIVTYILLTGLHAGIHVPSGFRPQILGETASRATLVVLFDFLFVKLGCYILNIQGSSQFVDIFAYTGYKFVGVILSIAVGFLGVSGWLWTLVFVYAFLANAFFLLRSLRSVVLPDPSISIATASNPTTTATVNPAQRRRRITFLFLEAVCQVVYMAALVRLPSA
ncbi:protein transporter yif1 [Ephemerocybe angulata]|uniref:Protein YIF1 n=1 Tax=Ephemerocybe angulata TaxID=980116 RepID=A0A8H6HTC5_9AGAR|nr:protein transporter yif1 [Tulosesus angulatus]